MFFIGYNPIGSYKLYNPMTKQVVYSREAMTEEIKSIERNGTWELVNLPINKTPIADSFVFVVFLHVSDVEVNDHH